FLPTVNTSTIKHKISKEIQTTFENLSSSFVKYFPSLNSKKDEWVVNPFVGCTDSSFSIKEEEDFIDLKNDLVHKASFAELELSTFWISLQNQYPELSMKALRSLLPFGSSYLCEIAFSS